MFVEMNALIAAKETFRPTCQTKMQGDEVWPAQVTPSGLVIVWLPDVTGVLHHIKFMGGDGRIYIVKTF